MGMRRTRLGLATGLAVMVGGCGVALELVEGTNFERGTYSATVFRITPDGQPPVDVLQAGGSLSITFDQSGGTTGTLVLPAGVTGGAAVNASMAGTATITGLSVTFSQTADTFVRAATWSRIGRTLQLNNYRIGNAVYDVALTIN